MNRGLIWGLIGTLALSAVALIYPRHSDNSSLISAVVVPAVRAARNDVPPSSAQITGSLSGARSPANSSPGFGYGQPEIWPRPVLEPATRSPFSPPVSAAPKPVIQARVASAVPPTPAPPPADFRFWGRMSSPDKQMLFFLAKGADGAPVEVHHGTKLDDGWAVESISDNAIVLVNAVTQQRTTILVPLADSAQAR
jgi:hypothetical protein